MPYVGTRRGDALPFATAQFDPIPETPAEHGFVSTRQTRDQLVCAGTPCCFSNCVSVRPIFQITHRDTVSGCSVIINRKLKQYRDHLAEFGEREISRINSIQLYPPAFRIINATQNLQ